MLYPNWRTFAHHSSSGSSYYSGPYFRLFVRVPNSRGDSKWMLINREDVSTTHDLSPLYPEKSRQAFPLDIQPSRPFRHFFLHRDPGNFMVIMRPQAVTENATRRGGTRWDEHQTDRQRRNGNVLHNFVFYWSQRPRVDVDVSQWIFWRLKSAFRMSSRNCRNITRRSSGENNGFNQNFPSISTTWLKHALPGVSPKWSWKSWYRVA